jgi:myosin heavy subunit
MEKGMNKTRAAWIAASAAVLIFAGFLVYRNLDMKDQLKNEKIRSESLFSEKLNLEKNLEMFKQQLATLEGKNAKLDRVIKETSDKLAKKEAEIRKLNAENASLAGLKQKNAELEQLRAQLEEDVRGLNLNLEKLMAESQQTKNDLQAMKTKNESLAEHNAILEAMLADNYLVEAVKGKHDRLTVMARRTDKLIVSFELPSDVGNNITFKINTPDGKVISSENNATATLTFKDIDQNYMASVSGTASGNKNTRRAELAYEPEHKLVKGVYRFSVFNGKEYVGSTQVKLR